ncbi:MAG: hypothetical protein OEL53_05110 [Rhodospirillales bacterium]|nr:hypothetical protein [Rhodospirillales bacterium]
MKDSRPPIIHLTAAAALGVSAALLLMALRVHSAISFSEPLMVAASGAEEEGVLGIIRAMEGLTYTDPFRIPFVASYYNWLFYDFYAAIGRFFLGRFGLDLIWLPTVGRFATLAGIALGFILTLQAALAVDPAATGLRLVYRRLLAASLAIGPLVGFWALSINPEIWATALAIGCAALIMRGYDKAPFFSVFLACLLSLLAWSFKQSVVFPALAMGLFLLIRRDWRCLSLAIALHLAGVGATLALGGEAYRKMLFIQADVPMAWWQFQNNILNLSLKATPFVAGAVLAALFLRRKHFQDTPGLFVLCGTLVSLLTIPMSAKIGAAENYFFLLVFFLAMVTLRLTAVFCISGWPRGAMAFMSGAWLAQMAACLAVVFGLQGVSSVAPLHARNQAQRTCVADLPSPMFSMQPYPTLPWMHAEGPAFLISYNYYMDRQKGLPFEENGVGGLIAKGWFASIVMPKGMHDFDGARLEDNYALAKEGCAGLDVFLLKPAPRP